MLTDTTVIWFCVFVTTNDDGTSLSSIHFIHSLLKQFATIIMVTKHKLLDPDPVHPQNKKSLKQQQEFFRSYFISSSNQQTTNDSTITIKIEHQQPSSSSFHTHSVNNNNNQVNFVDLTSESDHNTDNNGKQSQETLSNYSTDNNNANKTSLSITIESKTPQLSSVEDITVVPQFHHQQQPNISNSSVHSSLSAASLDSSQYKCDFNLYDIKQRYKPHNSNNNSGQQHKRVSSSPPQSVSSLNFSDSDDNDDDDSATHFHASNHRNNNSVVDDDISSSCFSEDDDDITDTYTLNGDSERSVNTDSNISQEYSIITNSLHFLDDASQHEETVQCGQCNASTTISVTDPR